MSDLKEKFNQIASQRKEIIDQIHDLSETESVKKYFALCHKNEILLREQKALYRKIKIREYSSCNHIWVNTLFADNHCNYCGCVKCGLDERVLYSAEHYHNLDYLTFNQRIMYDFIRNHYDSPEKGYLGINSYLFCDLDLAKAIYTRIKEKHPNIDDETAVKYLEASLRNIRETEVSDERKENRAERLSLERNFNKWNELDVMKH